MRIVAASFACALAACAAQGVVVTDDLTFVYAPDPACRPDTEPPIRVSALGDFPTTDSTVTFFDRHMPATAITGMPFDTRVLAADLDTTILGSSVTLSGTRVLGEASLTGQFLLLPSDRPCRLDDERLAVLPGQTIVSLPDGAVLFVGGLRDGSGTSQVLRLDAGATTTSLLATADALIVGRAYAAAALTGTRVVVAGGSLGTDPSAALAPIEVYDVASGRFDRDASAGLSFVHGRSHAAAVALPDGRVLVVGGIDDTGTGVGYGEIVDVAQKLVETDHVFLVTGGPHNLVDPWAGTLDDGTILVAGGSSDLLGTRTPNGVVQQFSPADRNFEIVGDGIAFHVLASPSLAALPGARLAYVGLDAAGTLGVELMQTPITGAPYTETTTLVGAPTMSSATAAALPDGRLLVGGADAAGNPVAYIVDLSRDVVQQVTAKVRATGIVALVSGALLELSPEGASVRRPSTLDAFGNPAMLLAGGTTEGIALDDGSHWVTTGGALVARPSPSVGVSRLAVPTLVLGDARLSFAATGDVRLLLSSPGLATKAVHVTDTEISIAGCGTTRATGQRVTVERRGEFLYLGVDGGTLQKCAATFGTTRFSVGMSIESGGSVANLRIERLPPSPPH